MSKKDTVKTHKNLFCKNCGWPIIDAYCNDEFRNFKDARVLGWWCYCSNKGCKNHDGEIEIEIKIGDIEIGDIVHYTIWCLRYSRKGLVSKIDGDFIHVISPPAILGIKRIIKLEKAPKYE